MKRTLRAVAGTVLIVTGSFVAGPAAPAAAATSCLTVPVTTPGFTVGVGGTPQRIPSFSGISVCASTPDGSPVAPVVSNSVGGSCVTSCTTVSLQVSPLDLGPLSVTYVQDGVTNRQTVDPQAVGTSQGVCLVSIGTPQAPNPACTLSLGSDRNLVAEVTALVNQTIAQVKPIVDVAVVRATTLVAGLQRTVQETAASLVTTGCNSVPDGPNGEDACTNPAGWTAATAFQVLADIGAEVDRQLAPVCGTFGPAPDGTELCGDPIQWTVSNLGSFDHRELIRQIRCWLFPDDPSCWW